MPGLPPVEQIFVVNASAFMAGIDEMLAGLDRLAKSIDDVALSAGKLDGSVSAAAGADERLAGAETAAAERADALLKGMDGLVYALDENAAAADRAGAAFDSMALQADKAGASAKRTSEETSAAGEKTALFGGAMKTALLGVGIAAVYGIDKAAKFQQSITMLHTQAGVATSQLKGLSQGVLQLAGQVGEGPQSLADSLYHVESSFASMGITAPKALELVKISAEGARTGQANLVDVTNALDAAVASGIPGVKNFSQAMGVLNATVGSGDMHMQDLADAFSTGLLAVVKGYGLSLKDVGAALATFGDNNIRGAKAGTDLRMAVQALAVPMATAKTQLAAMGLNSKSLAQDMQSGGLMKALTDLTDRFHKTGITAKNEGEVITSLFGKKAGSGIAVLLEQMDRLKSKYPDITKAANGFGDAWKNQQQTMAQQWADLKSGLDALAISFGTILLPAATKVVGVLARFANFLEKHQDLAAFAGAILAVAAGFKIAATAEALFTAVTDADPIMLVVMAIVALGFGIYELIRHWGAVMNVMRDVGRFFTGVFHDAVHIAGEALNWFVDGPVGRIVDAIAHFFAPAFHAAMHVAGEAVNWFVHGPLAFIKEQLGVFAQFWRAHGQQVKQIAHDVWSWVSTYIRVNIQIILDIVRAGMAVAKDVWKVAWTVIRDVTEAVWSVMTRIITTEWRIAWGFIKAGLEILKSAWNIAWVIIRDTVRMVWNVIANIVRTAVHLVLDVIGVALDLLTGKWGRAWHDLGKLASDALHGTVSIITSITSGFGTLLWDAGKSIIQGLINGIESMFGAIGNTMGSIGNFIKSFLPFSPAKQGPLSGSGDPRYSGRSIARNLAAGLADGKGQLHGAMTGLLSGGFGGAGGLAAGGAAGGGVNVTVHLTVNGFVGSNQQLVQELGYELQHFFLQQNHRNPTNGLALTFGR